MSSRVHIPRASPDANCRPVRAGGLRFVHDQSDAKREAHEARQVMDIEAAHDLCPVCLNGLDAEAQQLRNRFARVSFCHQLQDLALTWSERVERRDATACSIDVVVDDLPRHRWTE